MHYTPVSPFERLEKPTTMPSELIAFAELKGSPGKAPRSVGVVPFHSTACSLMRLASAEYPTACPKSLIP